MSNVKDKIEKLFTLFKSFADQTATPQADAPEKKWTSDELKISDTQVGGKVEIINGDGTLSPAPDGEYLFEDGNEYTVKDGLIVSVVTDSPEEDKAEGEMVQDAPAVETPKDETKPIDDLKAQVEEQAKAIDELKQAVAELQKALADDAAQEQAMSEQFNQKLDDLNNSLKTLATIPAEFSKTSSSNIVKDSNKEKGESIKSFFGLR